MKDWREKRVEETTSTMTASEADEEKVKERGRKGRGSASTFLEQS